MLVNDDSFFHNYRVLTAHFTAPLH
jgi:hypothetical protein